MTERSQQYAIKEIHAAARATHEINRLYCIAIGDLSQVPWDDAPSWQRDSAIDGVRAVAEGRATTPEQQHNEWMRKKESDGWTYGPKKDAVARTHPCMVPYTDLPESQRAKDAIFGAVVRGILSHRNDR